MSHVDLNDNACQQGTLLGVDCLTVRRNKQYIVYHVIICKTNARHDIACAHKVTCLCRSSSLSHIRAGVWYWTTLNPLRVTCVLAVCMSAPPGGHHRFKDHQANSALEDLYLDYNQIGNAGACAFADAIKATLVVARTILVLAFHGTISSARRCLILISLWSPLFWEKGGLIDSCCFRVWPRTLRGSTNPHNLCGHSCA